MLPDVVVSTFNPSTWEAQAGLFLWVRGHSGLHIKFQAASKSTISANKEQLLPIIKQPDLNMHNVCVDLNSAIPFVM